jgi:hypothetical protein
MKELWEHFLVRCAEPGICYWNQFSRENNSVRQRSLHGITWQATLAGRGARATYKAKIKPTH